jgi:small-conductance mechanosensitive channel
MQFSEVIANNQLIQSLLVVLVVFLLNLLLTKQLKSRPRSGDAGSRFLLNMLEKSTAIIIAICLIVIWFSEIRNFALSIAAFAVAIVIATREYIQSILGAVYVSVSRVFTVGDWIEIEGKVGEVVKSDWISTTLFEVDAEQSSYEYTGRTLSIPNNLFITHTVRNLNFMRRYRSHSFSITTEPEKYDVLKTKEYLLEQANFYCSEFKDIAERYNALIENRLGVRINGPGASVRFTTSDIGKYVFNVSVFCPTESAVEIEQKISDDFMRYFYQQTQAS